MDEKQKAKIIIKTLNKIYPKAPIPLKSKNTFTLLISVLLSAQCTDVNVNNVTKNIYPKYFKPEHLVKLGIKKIEKLIKKIGIFRVKAKSIYLMSKQLLEKHNGKVPKTFEELEKLPGVGHKTASVVMSQGFGYPAFAVDTHIHRLAQRWGLTSGKNVVQTEKDAQHATQTEKNLLLQKKLDMKILGIGNAIVDVICKVDDNFVIQNNLTKGTMKLFFDEKEFKKLLINLKIEKTVSGGSVANTIVGISQLGTKAGFIGKISDDKFGAEYEKGLKRENV